MKEIWTIGHSTHSAEAFLEMLKSFGIEHLADVRLFPASTRYPHFNKENLEQILAEKNIGYTHFKDLGGRRKAIKDSPNTAWKNDAFRGYADYMATSDFRNAVTQLEELAKRKRVAFMCAEAVWWSCHRSLISDYLKWKDWTVWHIMGKDKAQEHPFTKPAKIVDGKLSYREHDLFSE
jgi:uncharacterized protein (DUF488 family)